MPDWFYAPVPLQGPGVELTGDEAHHMARVLRMKPGERAVLFDGRGTEATAEIETVGRDRVALRILETRSSPEPQSPVILATAVPKGDRFRWLVEKATELGVSQLVPIETARSLVEPGAGKLDKLRQTVLAACKQSRRSRAMELVPMTSFAECCRRLDGSVALIAHPTGEPVGMVPLDRGPTRAILLMIGPEGGFTDEEFAAATASGARPASLGIGILRVETAALAIAAYVLLAGPSRAQTRTEPAAPA